MWVDFHFHSTASDGTDAPGELAGLTRGLAAAALTDHDSCDGTAAFGAAADGPARRYAGLELSIEPGDGFDQFHLLGLGVDPRNARLEMFLQRIRDEREARNDRICANFRRLGLPLTRAAVEAYAHGRVLARPHFARWLVDNGLARDVSDAFSRYLMRDAPPETRCYAERARPSQEEAFAVIHAAGGLCVMAHPRAWCRTWRTSGPDYAKAERELARLKACGLDGVEALYQANTPEEDVAFTRIAERLGLLKSAGSDYHGKAKIGLRLGMEVSERFIAPLLERLG